MRRGTTTSTPSASTTMRARRARSERRILYGMAAMVSSRVGTGADLVVDLGHARATIAGAPDGAGGWHGGPPGTRHAKVGWAGSVAAGASAALFVLRPGHYRAWFTPAWLGRLEWPVAGQGLLLISLIGCVVAQAQMGNGYFQLPYIEPKGSKLVTNRIKYTGVTILLLALR